MPRIGVVIPYFQRKPGILAKALSSVVRQDTASDLLIVVVDDGSPIDPTMEIASVPELQGKITLLRQKNAGPAAARNAGLEVLASKVDYVAFLDSDDTWAPDHLGRAERALSSAADFYFCDCRHEQATSTEFEQCGFPLEFPKQTRIAPDLYEHSTDFADTVLRYRIGTCTVVYNFVSLAYVRFPADFRYSHEDTLFWLEVAATGCRVAFSDTCSVALGTGVNIHASAGWATAQELWRLRDEVMFCRQVLRQYRLTDEQSRYMRGRLRYNRRYAMLNMLHEVKRGLPNRGALMKYLRAEPFTPIRLIPILIETLARQRRAKNRAI